VEAAKEGWQATSSLPRTFGENCHLSSLPTSQEHQRPWAIAELLKDSWVARVVG
jgi:hypothetical protein